MAENIAKIDEKIRELKRKKKAVENREKIKDQCEAIKAINQSLKNSKLKIEKITEIVGFLQEQESSGNWLSKWLAKKRVSKTTKIEFEFPQNRRDQHYKLRVDQLLSKPFFVFIYVICVESGRYLFLTTQELVNL